MKASQYNIRVYGIWINDRNEVLVTDEIRLGKQMTKFPGGGHELGEGLGRTVVREFEEELNIEIQIDKLFYINDFLQVSAFDPKDQILAIYYLVKPVGNVNIAVKEKAFDFQSKTEGAQIFRWIPLSRVSGKDFTFPIDQKVGNLLADYPESVSLL